jgi:hypothetical protein
MTNANSKQKMTGNLSLATEKISDQAPMVVTRLSGWIGSTDAKAPAAAWIIPTRVRAAN